MRYVGLALALFAIFLLAGCGGGGGFHPNPWAGEYLGTYGMLNDNGTLHVFIDGHGNLDGEWRSRIDGAYGPVWGDITRGGDFTLAMSWVTCWGHGEIWDGTRVLVIDSYQGRAPQGGKIEISNLVEKGKRAPEAGSFRQHPAQAGDSIGDGDATAPGRTGP